MELWLIKDDFKYNIMPLCNSLSWNTDVDMLGSQLDFSVAQNDGDKYLIDLGVESGDNIGLLDDDGNTVFRGVIIDVDKDACTCLDYAFYFAKNEDTVQFNKVSASKAIETLATRYGISHKIGDIRVTIDKIYFDETIEGMIKDILEQVYKSTGIKYRAYMNKNILTVDTLYDYRIDGLEIVEELSYKESLDGMYNSVKVVSGSEENYKVEAYLKDDVSISKYGVIQLIERIDDKDISKARNTAETLLKDNNKLKKSGSVVTVGDAKVRAGMQVSDIKNTRFTGSFLVSAVTHALKNGRYTMEMKLEVV